MNLAEALAGHPETVALPVDDPLALGFDVVGLPPGWRRTRHELVSGTPAACWLDATSFADQKPDSSEKSFVSSALLLAWQIRGLDRSASAIADLACGMTEDVPGWCQRSRDTASLPDGGILVVMCGSLESPFGTVVSNVHNAVIGGGASGHTLVQLVVSATGDQAGPADAVSLKPSAATGGGPISDTPVTAAVPAESQAHVTTATREQHTSSHSTQQRPADQHGRRNAVG